MSHRHRVFISFHHRFDRREKDQFERLFDVESDVILSGAVSDGDIDSDLRDETVRRKIRDEYLCDTSVTLVLVGRATWQRKHVDWEIFSSLYDTEPNPRSGLLGILLPSYLRSVEGSNRLAQLRPGVKFDPYTIPPRLYDNVDRGYASLHAWSNNPRTVQGWIHDAWLRRKRDDLRPDLSRPRFRKNRSGSRWWA